MKLLKLSDLIEALEFDSDKCVTLCSHYTSSSAAGRQSGYQEKVP
jgi:hypothetical protein